MELQKVDVAKVQQAFEDWTNYREAIIDACDTITRAGTDVEQYIAFDIGRMEFVAMSCKPYIEEGMLLLEDLSNVLAFCPFELDDDYTLYDYLLDIENYPNFERVFATSNWDFERVEIERLTQK